MSFRTLITIDFSVQFTLSLSVYQLTAANERVRLRLVFLGCCTDCDFCGTVREVFCFGFGFFSDVGMMMMQSGMVKTGLNSTYHTLLEGRTHPSIISTMLSCFRFKFRFELTFFFRF